MPAESGTRPARPERSDQVVSRSRRHPAARGAAAPLEVRLDERVEVAVEDRLHVAGLVACAFVLHELVRRERVRADLAAERDVALVAAERLHLLAPFLALPLGEPGREDLHRLGPVLQLRTFVLARHDDAGRQVRDAHRRVGDVHVLAARARRAVGVDAEVAGIDLGLLGLFERRDAVERRERGLAAGVGVERRDADQPVHAALAGEQCRTRSGP